MRYLAAFLLPLLASVAAHAADTEAGRKLVDEKGCETCHRAKTSGEPGAMYTRRDRHVTTLAKLKSQVALCNSELNLGLFPDEEEQVVEYLDATYYRFSSSRSISR